MSITSSTRHHESANDPAAGGVEQATPAAPVVPPAGFGFETGGRTDDEDVEVIQTEEEFEEFAHPAPGGAAGASSSLGTEAVPTPGLR